jgi:hypothetical protein
MRREKRKHKCDNCIFFDAETKKPEKGFNVRYGRCVRFPPTRRVGAGWVNDDHIPAGWGFPRMHSDQWCGEHRPAVKEGENE